ncbi:MAG TPA: bifunctional DNA-formamidopyrimidine glycosylase/DNA-(apurinic or apyrimidinic site) lyase [Solirubrobacterales bacterium]|nr:bifunctional DNA-formamidopyrimidine glycosylase/DNA-(apurinic or apyrimidinic site) lyase [Solirubrobacterales bacterium]
MPELPEVETIRRQLEPEITGRRIVAAEVLDERWARPTRPREVERALAGRTIEGVERRGKYLLLRLEGDSTLAMHLRMTGNLLLEDGSPDPPYLRAQLRLDGGRRLLFTDPRRFGHAVVLRDHELDQYFAARLGVEPLSDALTAAELCRRAAGRRAPLKSFLLNQLGVAGIGNIYADEALFRAELHPLSPAGSMKPEDCERLRLGIVEALEAGLRSGGASIDDYRDARGQQGAMQDEFLVHTREGKPCPRCGGEIERIVVAGRSTYFCPSCQRRLRRRPRRRARSRAAT